MGIRMALGARPWHLRRMVLTQAMTPVGIGVILGAAAALASGKLVGSMVYEVSTRDPAVIVTVMSVLRSVALAASWLPMQRATKVDPIETLRYE